MQKKSKASSIEFALALVLADSYMSRGQQLQQQPRLQEAEEAAAQRMGQQMETKMAPGKAL